MPPARANKSVRDASTTQEFISNTAPAPLHEMQSTPEKQLFDLPSKDDPPRRRHSRLSLPVNESDLASAARRISSGAPPSTADMSDNSDSTVEDRLQSPIERAVRAQLDIPGNTSVDAVGNLQKPSLGASLLGTVLASQPAIDDDSVTFFGADLHPDVPIVNAAPLESNHAAAPVVKVAAAPDVIELSNWCMAIVPNSVNVTKIDRSRCEDWIVLVGKRAGMVDLWHSSLITSRISERQVCTGSGRVYQLDGQIDTLGLIEVGFSFAIAEAFKDGFPWNWKDLLITDLCRMRRDIARTRGQSGSSLTPCTLESQPTAVPRAQRPSVNAAKRNIQSATLAGARNLPAPEASKPKRTAAARALRNDQGSESSDGLENHAVAPIVVDDERDDDSIPRTITESTRSGRRVMKPQPFWEARRATRSAGSAPEFPKRHWGNRVEL